MSQELKYRGRLAVFVWLVLLVEPSSWALRRFLVVPLIGTLQGNFDGSRCPSFFELNPLATRTLRSDWSIRSSIEEIHLLWWNRTSIFFSFSPNGTSNSVTDEEILRTWSGPESFKALACCCFSRKFGGGILCYLEIVSGRPLGAGRAKPRKYCECWANSFSCVIWYLKPSKHRIVFCPEFRIRLIILDSKRVVYFGNLYLRSKIIWLLRSSSLSFK